MPDKHYIYDSEGRRALRGKKLLNYYANQKNRDYYVQIARDLYHAMVVPGSDPPVVGDVFVIVFGALKANATFIEALLDHEVSLERAANKWFSYFAWMIVIDNWEAITRRTTEGGGQ